VRVTTGDEKLVQAFELAFNAFIQREFNGKILNEKTLEELKIATNMFATNFEKSIGMKMPQIIIKQNGQTIEFTIVEPRRKL
jgi:hypothetical protein